MTTGPSDQEHHLPLSPSHLPPQMKLSITHPRILDKLNVFPESLKRMAELLDILLEIIQEKLHKLVHILPLSVSVQLTIPVDCLNLPKYPGIHLLLLWQFSKDLTKVPNAQCLNIFTKTLPWFTHHSSSYRKIKAARPGQAKSTS